MISSGAKAFTIVFALLLTTGVVAVGCGQKAVKQTWVNTDSMPGRTFSDSVPSNAKKSSATIVYMGTDSSTSNSNFGPRDVSFDFKSLK